MMLQDAALEKPYPLSEIPSPSQCMLMYDKRTTSSAIAFLWRRDYTLYAYCRAAAHAMWDVTTD